MKKDRKSFNRFCTDIIVVAIIIILFEVCVDYISITNLIAVNNIPLEYKNLFIQDKIIISLIKIFAIVVGESVIIIIFFLYNKNKRVKDHLTGLYLRKELENDLDYLINKQMDFAIFSIDLNKFKQINDTYGHPVGDLILKKFARELELLPECTCSYRQGGDEFMVLIVGDNATICNTVRLISKISKQNISIVYDDKTINVELEFSGGLAKYPKDTSSKEELLKIVDKRLYMGKREN